MSDEDLKEFLKNKRWGLRDKGVLIDEYNSRLKPYERPLKLNAVSTPCRLRQVVGSLKLRILPSQAV